MDWNLLATSALVLVAFIGGWHTAQRTSRISAEAYNGLLLQVIELQGRYTEVVGENARLKGELAEIKMELQRYRERVDELSADIAALNDRDHDQNSD